VVDVERRIKKLLCSLRERKLCETPLVIIIVRIVLSHCNACERRKAVETFVGNQEETNKNPCY